MKRGKRGKTGYIAALTLSLTISLCCIGACQRDPVPLSKEIEDISLVASSRELAALSAGSLRAEASKVPRKSHRKMDVQVPRFLLSQSLTVNL
jgi:hypothetical protein